MGFVMFAVRRAGITLGSTKYIVESFKISNTGMTLFEMHFSMFLGVQNICQKRGAYGLFDRPTGGYESFAKSSKSYE
jgi:hypothetical protein